ncbi:MAG: hypothetical protein HQL69_22890 [Magnetococcales bacterium]|nr:hypothetical protein [Magnetococcales bacterium]
MDLDLDFDINDLVVPAWMVACYVTLMTIFFVASYFFPGLKDKKDKVNNLSLLVSFTAIPLTLIIWGVVTNY